MRTYLFISYANIFMDRLEKRLIQNAEVKPHIWWRYIDDIFIVWTEGEEKLKEFIDYLNNAHDTMRFKSSHDDKSYSINYNLNCNSSYVVYLITCKKCSLQYVGSTTTKFRLRFNNHKSRIRRHGMLTQAEKRADDLLYRHFCGEGHNGLSDVKIQLIDRVNGEQQLREKEGQWAYKLNTLDPNGLNDNDFFFVQNRRSRRT